MFTGSVAKLQQKHTWNIDVTEYLKLLLLQLSQRDIKGIYSYCRNECANTPNTAVLSGLACIYICACVHTQTASVCMCA